MRNTNVVTAEMPPEYAEISRFSKLMVVKGMVPEKIMQEFSNYIVSEMGSFFD